MQKFQFRIKIPLGKTGFNPSAITAGMTNLRSVGQPLTTKHDDRNGTKQHPGFGSEKRKTSQGWVAHAHVGPFKTKWSSYSGVSHVCGGYQGGLVTH